MLRFLPCFALLLPGCASPPEPRNVYLTPVVPADLRVGCPGPEWSAVTSDGALSQAIIEVVGALACANGKILAVDRILTDSAQRATDG
jgi:hypothetical protein